MRAKFTVAIILLILAPFLLWRLTQLGGFRHGWFPFPFPFPFQRPQAAAPAQRRSATASPTIVPSPSATTADNSDDSESEPPSEFVALRYDKNHVLFLLDDLGNSARLPHDFPQHLQPMNPPSVNVGLEVWEPDNDLLQSQRHFYDVVRAGEQWSLLLSGATTLPAVIQKPVVSGTECVYTAAFLAEIPASAQADFAASAKQYFLLSRKPLATKNTQPAQVAELTEWRASAALRKQIEQLLKTKMQEEFPKVRTEAAGGYEHMDETMRQNWKQIDESLARGQGKLDYDIQAFQLTPDRTPRLFIRAKWTIGDKPAFLMSLWARIDPALVVESVDTNESSAQRGSDFQATHFDLNSLGQVLNVFDPEGNGQGAFLFYKTGLEAFYVTLYRYTASGPLQTRISLEGGC